MWMELNCIESSDMSDSKGYVLYDSIYMTCWKKTKLQRQKKKIDRLLTTELHKGRLWGDRTVLYLNYGNGYMIVSF